METINITTMKVTWKENRKESQHIKKQTTKMKHKIEKEEKS